MCQENGSDCEEDEVTNEDTETTPGKRLGCRYWNSYEELSLVELWKLHALEVIQFIESTPVFREIALGMQKRGSNVNKQECRRKISTLHHKYHKELNKSKERQKPSEWRLFPLIHHIYNEPDVLIEDEKDVVRSVIAEMNMRNWNKNDELCLRTSVVMEHHFTLMGVEQLRKQNQLLSLECDEARHDLKRKKKQLRQLEQAYNSSADIFEVSSTQRNSSIIAINNFLPQVQNMALQTFAQL